MSNGALQEEKKIIPHTKTSTISGETTDSIAIPDSISILEIKKILHQHTATMAKEPNANSHMNNHSKGDTSGMERTGGTGSNP